MPVRKRPSDVEQKVDSLDRLPADPRGAAPVLVALVLTACDAQVRIESEPDGMGGTPAVVEPCNELGSLDTCCQAGCTWLNPYGEHFVGGCFADAQDCSGQLTLCSSEQVCLALAHTGGSRGQCPPKSYGLEETPWGVCLAECPADLPDLCLAGEGD